MHHTLRLDGQTIILIALRTFREQHQLPAAFGVATFEPKDTRGLARLDGAGPALTRLQKDVLAALPPRVTLPDLLAQCERLQRAFERALWAINAEVGLKDVEVDFAVAGFGDALHAYAYALIQARTTQQETPAFGEVYRQWLNEGVRLSQRVHTYQHQGADWQVRVLNNVYGRIGLAIQHGDTLSYVADVRLACPAESFMASLLGACAAHLAQHLTA